jgi:metallophosphoesterase
MGPLGQVSLDSPAGILGVRVELEEVPGEADPAAVSESALGEALSSDGAAYLSLVTHPELTIERGLRALVDDALRRAGLLESIMLCLVAAGRLATGGRLRDAVRAGLSRSAASSLLTATAAVTVVALLVPSLRSEPVTGNRLEVLAGTPLERARVSGRIGDVVQAYGGRVSAFLDDNTAFYTAAQANLRAAWEASQTIDGTTDVTAADGVVDTDRGARDPQDAASASAAPESASPSAEASATDSSSNATTARSGDRQGSITAVMTTDLHCNLDVIAFSGVLDALAGATVHMDDGDLTMTGSDPEQICVDALDNAVPDGVARVATIGNHDSASTAERLRTIGWTVTDGTVENVGGLQVLGDVDPERSPAGRTFQRGEENATDIGMRLAGVSCDATRKGKEADVVLIHRPDTFGPLVDEGCAPLLVAGHVHEERGMSTTRGGNLDVAQLISGAGKGGTSLGRVTQDAYMHVLSFDSDGDLLAWRTVTLHPDASVTVGAWEPVPEAG